MADVRVEGLREFQRACNKASKEVKSGMRKRLKAVGEPVRDEAERLAAANITNITPRWSRMRTGLSAGSVYVVPRARRQGGSPRPSMKGTLLGKAMVPALENKTQATVEEFERFLDEIVDDF